MLRDVVITGVGRVGPQGPGRNGLARALREGTPVPTRLCPSAHAAESAAKPTCEPVDYVGWVDQITPFGKVETGSSSDPIGRSESLAHAAAQLARREAGLPELSDAEAEGELWIATALGFAKGRLARADVGNRETWHRWLEATGAERLGGTVSEREASGLIAVAEAARAIEEERCDRAIVIEVDSVTPRILRVHRRLRALASGVGGKAPIARPFDRFRRGSVLAEGATAVILERESLVTDRGARPRSRLCSEFRATDASASPYGFGSRAKELGVSLREHLRDEEIEPHSIEGVIAGARGSIEADAQEAEWIESFFGGEAPPIFAPMGTTGLGGGGLLAAACLAAEGLPLCGTAGFSERDPALSLRPHPSAVSPTPRRILVSTLASGGQAAWLLFDPR